jgi:transcriptional antiterminator
LLKLEGLGFSQAEIVRELSQKSTCSERTVYRDFESRDSWQPILKSVANPEGILLKVVNRYEQIYRQASVRLLRLLMSLRYRNIIMSIRMLQRNLHLRVKATNGLELASVAWLTKGA